MENEYDLEYSNDALLDRVLFLSSQLKVNIFVEDAHKEYEYEEIFERLLPKKIEINCIFPTGGKQFLEEAYRLFGKTKDYGKCFFIADGDFDIALHKTTINSSNFIYLKRYNIESYLLNKDAIIRFMRPKLKKTLLETNKLVNYEKWFSELTPFYKKLFALHCLVQQHIPEVKNVGNKPERFIDEKGFPAEEKYSEYKDEFLKKIPDIDNNIETMKCSLEHIYGTDDSSFVCGKYYIVSLKRHLNNVCQGKKMNCDEIKAALISGFDISLLDYVKNKLICYLTENER